MFKKYFAASCAACVCALALAALLSLAVCRTSEPEKLMSAVGICAFSVGSLCASLFGTFLNSSPLYGASASLLYCAAFFTASLAVRNTYSRPMWQSGIIALGTFALSVGAAYLADRLKKGGSSARSRKKLLKKLR